MGFLGSIFDNSNPEGYEGLRKALGPGGEAAARRLTDGFCRVSDKLASAARFLGNDSLSNSIIAYGARAGCREVPLDGFQKTSPSPPFTGGQCAGVSYRVEFAFTLDSGTLTYPENTNLREEVPGPIKSISIYLNSQGQWMHTVVAGNPEQEYTHNQAVKPPHWRDYRVNRIVRVDGMPDDCGDPPSPPSEYHPPPDSVPPPEDGEEILPPGTVEIELEINGSPISVDVDVSPLVWVDNTYGISLEVNGVDIRIAPDGRMYDEPPPPATPTEPDPVAEALDRIAESVERDITGEFTLFGCEVGPLVAGYSGKGLLGIEAMFQTWANLNNEVTSSLCAQMGTTFELEREFLTSVSALGVGDVAMIGLPAKTHLVEISIAGSPPGLRVYKLAGPFSEGKFGYWSVGPQEVGAAYPGYSQLLHIRNQSIMAPVGLGIPLVLRVSLKQGLTANIYVRKEKSDGG